MIAASEGVSPWWFIYAGFRIVVQKDSLVIPRLQDPSQAGLRCTGSRHLGTLNGMPCYAGRLESPEDLPSGFVLVGLRHLFGSLPDRVIETAMLGMHLVLWDRTCIFCSACGASLADRQDVRAKECSRCGSLVFPRISPAVIVLVKRDDRLLLARSGRFEKGLYSVLAGFVEPGETLEAAVAREVKEEVGISLSNILYFGSQPWPFPDSLMIGFTADYESGEIAIDGNEIVEAQWFSASDLPHIPDRISIARQLIDWFVSTRLSR